MRIILKPLIHRCDGVVLLIAGAQIPMQKIRHDSKRDWMSTGLCIISSACTLQPVKYLRWHEECWSLAYLSRRYSLFKRLLKSRTHIDLHQTGPVPMHTSHPKKGKAMQSLQTACEDRLLRYAQIERQG